jgi:hypothetical protein
MSVAAKSNHAAVWTVSTKADSDPVGWIRQPIAIDTVGIGQRYEDSGNAAVNTVTSTFARKHWTEQM